VRLLGYKDKSRSSAVIGRFYALSTIGSIAGTFMGGYWLISWLGTRSILYGVAGILAAAALIVMPRGRKMPAALVLGACAGLGGYATLSLQESLDTGIDRDTLYNHIRIVEGSQDGHRTVYMITDPGSAQSGIRLDDPNHLLFDYTGHYAIGWHIKPDAREFLMLGGGGYSVPKHLLNVKRDATIDVVEIDPGITAAAREFFALKDNGRLRIFHEDARVFLNRMAEEKPGSYDMVMGDTFTSSYTIPFHLGTVECAGKIKALLRDDGVFVCNIISAVTGEQGKILRSIRAAFAQVFLQTHVFPVSMPRRPDLAQNVMLVALKTKKPVSLAWDAATQAMLAKEFKLPLEEDVVALTDDYAPVERYAMPMLEARK
jgi:spermidine synthase